MVENGRILRICDGLTKMMCLLLKPTETIFNYIKIE